MQSQDEGFALIPPAATTEPSSGAPAGPEDLRLEDARSSGGDADQGFLHEEDLRLEKDFEAYSGRKDFTASDRAGVQENGGSSDKAEGRGKDVEKPTHVMEEELAHAQEETRKAKLEALALSANHETVKQNMYRAEDAYQNAGGEFAADAIAVAAAEAEAADTPTSVPESVGEVGEEGDAQMNEEREEQAEGAAEGDGAADEKNEEREEEAEGAEAGDGSAAEAHKEKEEEAVGPEEEKEVAKVMTGEVGAAAGRPQREGAGVIGRRFSHAQFVPPKVVKPVPQSGKKP